MKIRTRHLTKYVNPTLWVESAPVAQCKTDSEEKQVCLGQQMYYVLDNKCILLGQLMYYGLDNKCILLRQLMYYGLVNMPPIKTLPEAQRTQGIDSLT